MLEEAAQRHQFVHRCAWRRLLPVPFYADGAFWAEPGFSGYGVGGVLAGQGSTWDGR
jgi:hypothetical protein